MIEQNPSPGALTIRHCGDDFVIDVRVSGHGDGTAWLRTNLGRVALRRYEVLAHAEEGKAVLGRDWHDVPMSKTADGEWTARLPLVETGCFAAKAFFEKSSGEVIWPSGPDVVVKVEPAETLLGNSIYTVFPRQFGDNRRLARSHPAHPRTVGQLDRAGYCVIPPSGTFRDVIGQLDFIMGELGFRIIQVLPIHPVPTTYARMGRFGSPFAATDFFSVDPALAEFDRRSTPLDQFRELVDAVHARRGRVFIDLPANHTGWGSHFQTHHPDWFSRTEDGSFESPGAWGVVWADLCKLDYRQSELWRAMAEVFLFWCRQGVDGFRCDAGYMVPLEVWIYISAKVRNEFPDCVFLLEGLGGPIRVMASLLSDGNLNWAYSELFQNYTREQITAYLPECNRRSRENGTLVHFAETHDNNRLAATSPGYARMRTALCALFSHGGAFGITNGVEWYATEKVNVHGASALNWGSEDNQVQWLKRLLAVLEAHPAFRMGARQRLIQCGQDNTLALLREPTGHGESVLVLVNLSIENAAEVAWQAHDFPLPGGGHWLDLLRRERIRAKESGKGSIVCVLPPGRVVCLAASDTHLDSIDAAINTAATDRVRAEFQRFRKAALQIWQAETGFGNLGSFDVERAARTLKDKGIYALHESLAEWEGPAKVVTWQYPADCRRVVMMPPGHMVYVRVDRHFLVQIHDGPRALRRAFGLPCPDGGEFAVLMPFEAVDRPRKLELRLAVFGKDQPVHATGSLLLLPEGRSVVPQSVFSPGQFRNGELHGLCANELGGIAQVRGAWGHLESQYDALLAANCHPDYPVDRQVMLRRIRGWVVYRDFSQDLDRDCQETFEIDHAGDPAWCFDVPVGQGRTAGIRASLRISPSGNAVKVSFLRQPGGDRVHSLADAAAIRLILRPDIEDRSCHDRTFAMAGPETAFPQAIRAEPDGFTFNPSGDRELYMRASKGAFVSEPEWLYMIEQPFEQDRGLNPHTDVFSPGYFRCELRGDERIEIKAGVGPHTQTSAELPFGQPAHKSNPGATAEHVLQRAIGQFVVRREAFRTVIAGYPWFLDWGRDTLICLRGIAAAGRLDECRDILLQFARFEKSGTLPNMIRGDDDSDRDTSDAPLWLSVACREFIAEAGNDDVLGRDVGGRTFLAALVSVAENYLSGTPNGIAVDPDSGLVFSPSHFTWMDTNHPAGSPREGYPVEIQALWYVSLANLAEWTGEKRWRDLSRKVARSLASRFVRPGRAALADCLHASRGTPAAKATPDDHCRPNQLLAVTLGALKDADASAGVVRSCECLLVPGGIRSLADMPVAYPLAVETNGNLLNDPNHPYWGRYTGDEDTRRKPAYHNGTAWSWQFPLYPEALFAVHGEPVRETALSLLMSSVELLNSGCVGQIPEILDGDAPHQQRGCGAQAWGVTELYRVRRLLLG